MKSDLTIDTTTGLKGKKDIHEDTHTLPQFSYGRYIINDNFR